MIIINGNMLSREIYENLKQTSIAANVWENEFGLATWEETFAGLGFTSFSYKSNSCDFELSEYEYTVFLLRFT